MHAVQSRHGDPNALTPFGSLVVSADAPSTVQTLLAPGNYVALNLTGNGPAANVAQFRSRRRPRRQRCRRPQRPRPRSSSAHGARVLHDGTTVRLVNGGYLVHMDVLIGARNKAGADKIVALLKAGKDGKAQRARGRGSAGA